MQFKKYITLLASALLLFACAKEEFDTPTSTPDGPVTVGFWVGRGDTRTETPNAGFEMDAPLGAETTRTQINNDGISTSWSKDDKIALWATNNANQNVLSETPFHIYYRDSFLGENTEATPYDNYAMFTTTLESPMPEGEYTYYATYPTPKSTSGTSASFTLASSQDGLMGNGAAIMVAEPATYHQLQKVLDVPGDQEIDDDHLSLVMKHKTHALRFYVPSTMWGFDDGEKIERIIFSMPQNIAGDVSLNYTDAANPIATANCVNMITMNLANPIGASASASAIEHAVAAILPQNNAFDTNDVMEVKVFTNKQASQCSISLAGRGRMLEGHITRVALNCSNVTDRPKISFRIANNNLGEQPYKITLTSANTSTQWKDGDDHIYEYYTGSETSTIANGSGFDIYYDEETLPSISGETVTVTYESKSAIVTETITMPTMTNGNSYSMNLNVPWLLYQDFSSIAGYNDEATTGSKTLDSVGLPGWTASRTRSSAGSHIRLRPFYAIIGRYQGRLDSEFFGSRLKKSVDVSVTINAGADQIATPLQVGKTTTSGSIEAGTIIESVSTTLTLAKGTNSSMPEFTYTVKGVTANHRLSWRTNITSGSWTAYSDTPIDNIRVKIAQ